MRTKSLLNRWLIIILSISLVWSSFPPLQGSTYAEAAKQSPIPTETADTSVPSAVPSPEPSARVEPQPMPTPQNSTEDTLSQKSSMSNDSSESYLKYSVVPDGPVIVGEPVNGIQVKINEIKAKYANRKASNDSSRMAINSLQPEPSMTNEQIAELISKGATIEDIYEAAYLSMESGVDPVKLYEEFKSNKLYTTWDQLREAYIPSSNTTVTKDTYLETSAWEANSLRSPVLESAYSPYRSSVMKDVYTETGNNPLLTAFDYRVNGVIDKDVIKQINQTYKPQYSDRADSSETIDPITGSLTWKQNQFTLPGRDGLDFSLGVMYQSNQALARRPYGSNVTSDNYLSKKYDLGTGWSFRLPNLQFDLTLSDKTMYYHDGEGGVYEIGSKDTDPLSQTTQLIGYPGKDKKFVYDPNQSFTNGTEKSNYYIEYADKRREYFGGNMKLLLGIVDRFGNEITFHYQEVPYGFMPLLSEIKDSVGRTIVFQYDPRSNVQVPENGRGQKEDLTVIVKAPNGQESQRVVYERAREGYYFSSYSLQPGDHSKITYWDPGPMIALRSIVKPEGEKVSFEYAVSEATFNPEYKYYDTWYWATYVGVSFLLDTTRYNHSSTKYTYGQIPRNLGRKGSINEFQITNRYDQLIKNNTDSGRMNEQTFEYEGTADGFPIYYETSDMQESDYSISKVINTNQTTTRRFNEKRQLIFTETKAANEERTVIKNTQFHNSFKYLPTKTEQWLYNAGDTDASAAKFYQETGYDDLGSVNSETRLLDESQNNDPGLKSKFTTTYAYEPNHHQLSSKAWFKDVNGPQLQETYTYTPEGRIATITNPLNEITTFSYEYLPDKKQITRSSATSAKDGAVFSEINQYFTKDTEYSLPAQEDRVFTSNGSRQVVSKYNKYDLGSGRIVELKDGNNNKTTYTYDQLGRIKKETYPTRTNDNGEQYLEVVDYNYYRESSPNFDAVNAGVYTLKVNSIHTVTKVSTNQSMSTNSAIYYNGLGSALMEERLDPNAKTWVFTHYRYDDQGRPVYSRDPAGNTLTASYDAWGRQNRATNANNDQMISDYNFKTRTSTSYIKDHTNGEVLNYVEQSYDPWGNKLSAATYKDWPTNQQRIAESYRYDIMGNVTGYTDPNHNLNEDGVTTSFAYDALGRLTSLKDALNQTTNYSYDGNGQVTKVTIQAKGGTPQTLNTKSYNELGLPSVKQDGASQSESYTYNSLGQLAAKTDRNGSSFDYVYDEGGQLKSSTIRGNMNNVAQTQVTKMISGDGSPDKQTVRTFTNGVETASHTQTQNSLGQVSSVYSKSGAHAASIGNQLDVLGRMKQITDNYMGFSANYQYSKERLDKVQTNGSSTLNSDPSVNAQYSYYTNNQIQRIVYPTLTDGSQLITTYTYNKALGWTESMENTKGSGSLSSYSYSYDNNGNRVAVRESRNGGAVQTTHYSYDALNRLISTTRPDGGQTTYTYDVRGNRLTLSDTSTVSLDSADTSYTYDLQNTLTSVTKGGANTSFKYYANGMRSMKTKGNIQTQVNYDFQGQVISEEKLVNGTFVEQANFVRGDRVLVKKDKKAAKDYYYLYNGHGDVVQIVDTNGTVVNNYAYDEWGNITSQDEKTSNPFKYTGEVYDQETGLYYLRARYYDPSMGRFLNEDTYEGQITNPLSQNLYTYVHNNPLIYTDPTGHYTFKDDPSQPAVVQGYVVSTDMHASEKLVEFLKTYETFSGQWYYATKEEKERNIKTIGYGHVIKPGEEKLLKGITEEQAQSLLKSDIQNKAENYINDWADRNDIIFTQQQFDALVSWKFNGGDFLNRDPGKMLKEGVFSSSKFQNEFKNEMLLWVKGSGKKLPGLYMRRYDEWEIFVNGDYARYYNRVLPKGF
ncbi:RHS repeat-associated core domain-containing protein [Paenibacillus sp. FSL H7-0756]|uniref:RHS repeat-associated core domain-containing protein n=1 Tax=Paenibacillus sp. FSL H7-0756 TaxID=2954738 RepID=UPI0030F625C5